MVLKINQATSASKSVTDRASDYSNHREQNKAAIRDGSNRTDSDHTGNILTGGDRAGSRIADGKTNLDLAKGDDLQELNQETLTSMSTMTGLEEEKTAREERLIQGARDFDQNALAEIYDLYSDELYYYALRKLGTAELAEECVADTFSRFLQTLQRGKGPRDYLRAYLYRAAHNWITSYYQRRPPPSSDIDDLQIHAEDGEGDPFRNVTLQQTQEQVRLALTQLTPDQRQVIALKYLEGWKNKEIAEAIEKPVGAVKSLQHRALNALRRILLSGDEHDLLSNDSLGNSPGGWGG
ncbi:MAG: RNA polymerase sigma factor [Chloroflexota bacterium]